MEEDGGTFDIRYRPAGGTVDDETVIDSGATARYDRSEVSFDDGGFRLAFVRNDSSLNSVDVNTGGAVEVALRDDTASVDRIGGPRNSRQPGDIVVIDDRCNVGDPASTWDPGSRLMYVEIPSVWIDPTLQARRAGAVFLNGVAVKPSRTGFLTVYPCGGARPLAASVNYRAGEAAPNAVLAGVGSGGEVCIYSTADTDGRHRRPTSSSTSTDTSSRCRRLVDSLPVAYSRHGRDPRLRDFRWSIPRCRARRCRRDDRVDRRRSPLTDTVRRRCS